MKKKVFIISQYLINDPPTYNTLLYLSKIFDVTYYEQSLNKSLPEQLKDISYKRVYGFNFLKLHFVKRIVAITWLHYIINKDIRLHKPYAVIAIMYEPISIIKVLKNTIYIASILDIPEIKYSGKIDRIIFKKAVKQLKFWDIVWASDPLKGKWIKQKAALDKEIQISFNCPVIDYFKNMEKPSVRAEIIKTLIAKGLIVTNESIILVRAGAVGIYGGIEETILAIKSLPSQFVFVLMGRPNADYKQFLIDFIKTHQLNNKVILFDKPNDIEWKKILLASDIGHLIHLRPDDNPKEAASYDLNSSLSNNRLAQYMAAGLPIISYNDPRMDLIYNEIDCFEIVNTETIRLDIQRILYDLSISHTRRLEMGENARKAFECTYNWESQFNKVYKLIDDINSN